MTPSPDYCGFCVLDDRRRGEIEYEIFIVGQVTPVMYVCEQCALQTISDVRLKEQKSPLKYKLAMRRVIKK